MPHSVPVPPAGPPPKLFLACDARIERTDYADDQVWELRLRGGDAPALALQTTYGLRARQMKIFYRFSEGASARIDPSTFDTPIHLIGVFPNLAHLAFSPFNGIDVLAEIWVPTSHNLAGRLRFTNASSVARIIQFDLNAQLIPLAGGTSMAPISSETGASLQGRSGELAPVIFMTGGPGLGSGSFPSLSMMIALEAGATRQVSWAEAALSEAAASFELARQTTALPWEASTARIELLDTSSRVDIETGQPPVDTSIVVSQNEAHRLLQSAKHSLTRNSFTISRLPDQGWSRRGNGSDYPPAWSGQTALDAYVLASALLPGDPDTIKGCLRNFISTQQPDGRIDFKPGLAGQLTSLKTQPILCSLAWQVYEEADLDLAFLQEVYPALLSYLQDWLNPAGGLLPTWEHALQSGFEDNPLFDLWKPGAQGIDPRSVINPSLLALLYRECLSLIEIARSVGKTDVLDWLTEKADHLKASVEACWDENSGSYRYVEQGLGSTAAGEILYSGEADTRLDLDKDFDPPRHLCLQASLSSAVTRPLAVMIVGADAVGPFIETITPRSMRWMDQRVCVTSQKAFAHVESIEIRGLGQSDDVKIATLDTRQQDLTLLLPLWAGIPAPKRAEIMVEKLIGSSGRFSTESGLSLWPQDAPAPEEPSLTGVYPVWNAFIIEGLLRYGLIDLAGELLDKLALNMSGSLAEYGAFYRCFLLNREPVSEENPLSGLFPVRLALKLLGMQVNSQNRILIRGNSPYDMPVTVKYRGMKMIRQKEQAQIAFPNGQSVLVSGPGTHLVTTARDQE